MTRETWPGQDGYERMHWAETAGGWRAIASWGREGWNLLDWPYYVAYFKEIDGAYFLATDCEGDIDVHMFASEDERSAAVDKLAFWHWQQRGESWVAGLDRIEQKPKLMGPYSMRRSESA